MLSQSCTQNAFDKRCYFGVVYTFFPICISNKWELIEDVFFFSLQLHIDVHSEPTSPDAKAEVDFFSEHTKDTFREDYPIAADQKLSAPEPVKNGTLGENAKGMYPYMGVCLLLENLPF